MTLTAFPTLGLFFPNTRKSRPGNFRSVVSLFFFSPFVNNNGEHSVSSVCAPGVALCVAVTGSSGLIVPPATARHHEEGLKRGAAETVDGIKVPGREGSVLAGKGKRLEEEAPNARGFSEPGFPASGARASVCLSVCGRPAWCVLQSWESGLFRDSSPHPLPAPVTQDCRHLALASGAAAWERSGAVLRDRAAGPVPGRGRARGEGGRCSAGRKVNFPAVAWRQVDRCGVS